MTAITNKDRQKHYHANMKAKGYVRIEAWVKKEHKDYIKNLIKDTLINIKEISWRDQLKEKLYAIPPLQTEEDETQNSSDTVPKFHENE